jgi:hypothetical protein
MRTASARDIALALISARAEDATICPSEVARALSAAAQEMDSQAWRRAMPEVHATVDRLIVEGLVQLSWKGKALARRDGPYRIGRSSKR